MTKAIASVKAETDKVGGHFLEDVTSYLVSYFPEKPVRLNRELLRYRAGLVKIQVGSRTRSTLF